MGSKNNNNNTCLIVRSSTGFYIGGLHASRCFGDVFGFGGGQDVNVHLKVGSCWMSPPLEP